MESYDRAHIAKILLKSPTQTLTTEGVRILLNIRQKSSLYRILRQMQKSNILEKIERDKYLVRSLPVSDFYIANTLYIPSYISFESALNFHGIISQFPYEITSATTKKTTHKIIQDKLYTYTHITNLLYWGYEKKDTYLMAQPEKALLDQLYLIAKGVRAIHIDELDVSTLHIKKLDKYKAQYPKTKKFIQLYAEVIALMKS